MFAESPLRTGAVGHWGRRLRSRLRGARYTVLSGQLLGFLSPVMAHDVRPEFDDFRADDSLGSNRESPRDRTADRSIGRRIVNVGDRGAHQIAHDVCIIRSPGTVISLAPHGAACCPKSTPGVTACALLVVARIFAQRAGQHSVTQEIADEVVPVRGA